MSKHLPLRFDVLSLFPEAFSGPLETSILGRAREQGLIEVGLVDIRDFATDKHRRVDDRPYGGGAGMVMMAEPVERAIESVRGKESRVVLLSPRGQKFDGACARRLAEEEHLVLLCGHYEGVDQRVQVDEEISIGDYVLTSGCLPAMVVIDAVSRFVPGVLGNEESAVQGSFEQYTRPPVHRGRAVPEVLLSGDHKAIEAWRRG